MPDKKPAAVVAAEAARDAKAVELDAAREVVSRLERELAQAQGDVRRAKEEADTGLPQCRLIYKAWRTGHESDGRSVVILKRTPSGVLVTRPFGGVPDVEWRFKWDKFRGMYAQAEKNSGFGPTRELRDVPPEFMPKEPGHA